MVASPALLSLASWALPWHIASRQHNTAHLASPVNHGLREGLLDLVCFSTAQVGVLVEVPVSREVVQ